MRVSVPNEVVVFLYPLHERTEGNGGRGAEMVYLSPGQLPPAKAAMAPCQSGKFHL